MHKQTFEWLKPVMSVKPASGVVLAALLLVACNKDDQQKAKTAAPAPSVVVSAARLDEIRQSAQFVGKIEAVNSVDLIARVSGFLDSKTVPDGSTVKKDQLLFTIEKAPYQAALLAAQADQAKAEANAALSQADLERDKDLYEKGHVSKAKYQATLATKEEADAMVEAAKAAVSQAQLNLGYTDVKAPFDGKIGKTPYSVGEVVGPSSQPLAHLVSLAPVYVSFSISEKDYLDSIKKGGDSPEDVKKDDRPSISLIMPNGKKFSETGEIVFIDNRIDPLTSTIALRGQFENKNKLLLEGTYVTVVLEAKTETKAIVVPQAAVQRDQKGSFVLAVNKQEMVEQRYVELGQVHETDFIVTSGLQPGERVIVQGLQKVRPGVPVHAVVDGKPAE